MDLNIKQLVVDQLELGNRDIKIILAGEVAAGKSNLISKIFNRRKVAYGSVPATKTCQKYTSTGQHDGEEYRITITDTPGLNDSDSDDEGFESIHSVLKDCHLMLYCISAQTRMTRYLKDALNRIGNMREQGDVWGKTVFVITHADLLKKDESEVLRQWRQSISERVPSTKSARFVLCGNGRRWDKPAASLGLHLEGEHIVSAKINFLFVP